MKVKQKTEPRKFIYAVNEHEEQSEFPKKVQKKTGEIWNRYWLNGQRGAWYVIYDRADEAILGFAVIWKTKFGFDLEKFMVNIYGYSKAYDLSEDLVNGL